MPSLWILGFCRWKKSIATQLVTSMILFVYSSAIIFNIIFCSGHELTVANFCMVQLERGLHGLEPVVVANFPTKKYSDEFFSAAGDAQYVLSLVVEFLDVLDFMCFS